MRAIVHFALLARAHASRPQPKAYAIIIHTSHRTKNILRTSYNIVLCESSYSPLNLWHGSGRQPNSSHTYIHTHTYHQPMPTEISKLWVASIIFIIFVYGYIYIYISICVPQLVNIMFPIADTHRLFGSMWILHTLIMYATWSRHSPPINSSCYPKIELMINYVLFIASNENHRNSACWLAGGMHASNHCWSSVRR